MKFSIIAIALLISLLTIPLTAADWVGDTLKIKVFSINNITFDGCVNGGVGTNNSCTTDDYTMRFNVTFDSSELNLNDKKFQFWVNIQNGTVWSSPDFTYLVESTASFTNVDWYDNWTRTNAELITCKIQRGQFESQLNSCLQKVGIYEGVNATKCKEDLSTCTLSLKTKDIDLGAKDEKIIAIQEESDSKQNSRWIYGIVGVIAGILGLLFYQGKVGGGPKERSMGEFNKGQAG